MSDHQTVLHQTGLISSYDRWTPISPPRGGLKHHPHYQTLCRRGACHRGPSRHDSEGALLDDLAR